MKTISKTRKNLSSKSSLMDYTRFEEFLIDNRKEKEIKLFYDIETLQYNEDQGRKKPTKYKNVTFSLAVSYFNDDELDIVIFPNFYEFFETIKNALSKWKRHPKFNLIAHNGNKYDNHFMRYDLIYYYNLPSKNIFLTNATKEGNALSVKKTKITKEEKTNGIILEKRVKSSNNLEMCFYLNGIEFFTTDNLIKTNTSAKTLGEKLYNIGVLTKDELKTSFDYTKYNKDYDMSDEQAKAYALKVFNQLNDEEITYIKNDVIILGQCVNNYGKIFKGFDYNKITFTSNILEEFNYNDLTSYQLLKSVGKGKEKTHVKYTDYKFANENLYDYIKPFYRGGLNMYNDAYVGEILNEELFSIDINSSYPYVMHNFKVPTFLNSYKAYEYEKRVKVIKDDNYFFMYRMYKHTFDKEILSKIKSKIIRQMLVKYYTTNDFININTYTLKMIENITNLKFDNIKVISYLCFDCVYFGSRDKIEEYYYIKTKGSHDYKINIKSPYDMEILNEKNEDVFSFEEIVISKVYLNGLYGIPALRPYFNIFKWVGDDLVNVHNGYKNNERNIVFSVFVTAVALYNLLSPFKYLTNKEIDDCFVYCDTDSLYLKSKIKHKLSDDLFHPLNLGKWDVQTEKIEKFIVVNHKKYAYYYYNEKYKEYKINIACGGIPKDSFDTGMSFEEFVDTQFSEGKEIMNTKGIYNEQGTISIYPSTTKLSVGGEYRMITNDLFYDMEKEMMFNEIRSEFEKTGNDDIMYIESDLGSFSFSDLYPITNEVEDKEDIMFLLSTENSMKDRLGML